MVLIFIFYIVLALFFLFCGLSEADKNERGAFGAGILFTLCVIIVIAVGCLLWGEETIKPIDVYRGNTTLEITYKDSVAIDSVVVWK
jgi:hypothetical protein